MGKLEFFIAGSSGENSLPGKSVKALLLPVPTIAKSDKVIEQFKQYVQLVSPKKFMLDSGGFQIWLAEQMHLKKIDEARKKKRFFDSTKPVFMSRDDMPIFAGKTINLKPWHIIDTAIRLKPRMPDIITALDYPINKIIGKYEQNMEFMKKLGFNLKWAVETAELRNRYCPEVDLFIPVQCFTVEQVELFLNALNGIEYDGVSLPVRNLSVEKLASFFVLFHQFEIKRIHILGSTSLRRIAFAAYMARNYFDWVSVDSQSWRQAAQYHTYLNNHDLGNEYVGDEVDFRDDVSIDCECPWCKGMTFIDIRDMDYTDRTSFLMSHNFWVINDVSKKLYEKATDLWTFRNYLSKITSRPEHVEEIYRSISDFERLINMS